MIERPTSQARSDATALVAANHISPRSTLDRSKVTARLSSSFSSSDARACRERAVEIVEKRVVTVAHRVYEVGEERPGRLRAARQHPVEESVDILVSSSCRLTAVQ